MTRADVSIAALTDALNAHLDDDARSWLAKTRDAAARDATILDREFATVGRRCGREQLADGWTADDAARVALIAAAQSSGDDIGQVCKDLYRYGDANEKRAVLLALSYLSIEDSALHIVHDALRTNDVRLVAAALGPYAATHLDAAAYRNAILKCLFVGVPLDLVAGLDRRLDSELARMLAGFAHERIAAGRDIPADVWPLLARFPAAVEHAGIRAELHSQVPDRRRAAERAVAALDAATNNLSTEGE